MIAVNALRQGNAFDGPEPDLISLVLGLQAGDDLAGNIVEGMKNGDVKKQKAGWSRDSAGLLRYHGAVYIPPSQAVRMEILRICHDDLLAGHFGVKKTLELVHRKYYWPSLAKDVREYVQGCGMCQRTKVVRHKPYGEMQALPLPAKPFESISMDFITDLPPSMEPGSSRAYDSILVIVDRYTKVVKYISCTKTIDAPELAHLFLRFWVKDQGVPKDIVSDRGSVFTSKFWSAFCFYLKVKRKLSTAFHPQTDGQTERQNQGIEAYLRIYCNQHQDNWAELLHSAEFAYNNSHHDSIGMSPNMARYGMNLETRQGVEADPLRGEIPAAKDRATEILDLRKELEVTWAKTKEAQAKYYNKRHQPNQYSVGELVLLSAKNIRTTQPSKKLGHKYLGPFAILERIGRQAYRLDLPKRYKAIHNVFHVSVLERYHKGPNEKFDEPGPNVVEGEEEWEVEEILDYRVVSRGRKQQHEYLVRWAGYSQAHDQWVPIEDFGDSLDVIKQYHKNHPNASQPSQTKSRKRKR